MKKVNHSELSSYHPKLQHINRSHIMSLHTNIFAEFANQTINKKMELN